MAKTIIRAPSGVPLPDLRSLVASREVLFFLAWRDIKIRYRQTFFGVAWALVQPLLLMVVFAVVLRRAVHYPGQHLPYPLFALIGLVLWTFVSQASTAAAESLVENAAMVTKVYFPRMLMPMAATLAFVPDLLFGGAALACLAGWYGQGVDARVALLPAYLLLMVVTTAGIGAFFAAVNARYRDVRYALPFLIQVGLFLAPVVYATTSLPASIRSWTYLNPYVCVINGVRSMFSGAPGPSPSQALLSLLVASAVVAGGLLYFARSETTVADVI